jgi:lipid II:glycine glycyltransferase (peptidoglycan interpeptide bridge formation enzyme)
LARAERRGEMLAGMLFLIHGSRATYHIGWSDTDARKRNLHNVLMWRAILELKRRQIRWLDLGGVNTDALPGISRFKFGTGGRLTVLNGTYL